jgi:dTDP-4-dehydrorhamnose reductase
MKVLVTGASGMLGLEVSRAAVKRLGKRNVVGLTHYDMDITNPDMVGATLDRHKPDVLINCAGLVKGREATEKAFMWVNAQAPWALAHPEGYDG